MTARSMLMILVLTTVSCRSTVGQAGVGAMDVRSAQVDAVFADILPGRPGCAVGVYRDGEVVLTRGYGVASMEDGRPITSRTLFNLGSASKPFTALAVLMLEEQGRLSLDDDLRRYVPELPDYGTPIRIRDLLQHSTGIRDYGTLGLLAGRDAHTMPEFVTLMSSQLGLNFPAGTRHEYSHSDFEILGLVVERLTGEPFGTYMEREVFTPLGMTSTRVHDERGLTIRQRAFGHVVSSDTVHMLFPTDALVGGGNVHTSVEDLKHWDRALAEGATGRRPLIGRMLGRPTLANGDTIPYAFGIRTEEHRGLPTVARGGHVPGIRSEIRRFQHHGVTVAAMCNADNLYAAQRAQRVADVFLGDAVPPRAPTQPPPPAVAISIAELQRYIGFYDAQDQPDRVRITIFDGKLAELLGDTVQTFTYRGGGQFTGDGSPGDFRFQFAQPAAGGPMRLEFLSEGDVVASLERVQEADVWRPSAGELSAYAGTYFSSEVDAVWQLAVSGERLVLRRPGRPDGPLIPYETDVFTRHFGAWNEPIVARLQFVRDASGRVTHISITTPPDRDVVRGLIFRKANP